MRERTGERWIKNKEGEKEREEDREALLSHHISRVYGVRGKEGQQTYRAESDGGTRERESRELVVRGPWKRRTKRGGNYGETHGSPVVMATPLRRSLVTPSA